MRVIRAIGGLMLGASLAITGCSAEDNNIDADVDADDDCVTECENAHTDCVAGCDEDSCVVDCDTTRTDCEEECE